MNTNQNNFYKEKCKNCMKILPLIKSYLIKIFLKCQLQSINKVSNQTDTNGTIIDTILAEQGNTQI